MKHGASRTKHDPSDDMRVGNPSEDPAASALLTFLDGVTFYRPVTVYLSTPITTGPWFYEEISRRGGQGRLEEVDPSLLAAVRDQAIEVNRKITLGLLQRVKESLPQHNFINPANLKVETWTQEQYISFWFNVIERAAGRVVLAPGWAYSTGCTHECVRAMSHNIPVSDHELNVLEPRKAYSEVQSAIAHVERLGLDPTSLRESEVALERLA